MWPFGSRRTDARLSPVVADLLLQRVVLIRGSLDDDQATAAMAKLLFLQDQDPSEPITLLIDSPGGPVAAAMAVIDTIRGLSPPVRTRCDGCAHATAAVLLACGRRGERSVVRGGELSLTPLTGAPSAERERVRLLLARVIAGASGQAVESVEADLDYGRSFDPLSSAVEYGLVDRVG
jgi:ATP-dependent Clp protease protease subunit